MRKERERERERERKIDESSHTIGTHMVASKQKQKKKGIKNKLQTIKIKKIKTEKRTRIRSAHIWLQAQKKISQNAHSHNIGTHMAVLLVKLVPAMLQM